MKTPTHIDILATLHSRNELHYKLGVLRKGVLVHETPFRPHLITDAGLDNVGTSPWLQQLNNCLLGTGPAVAVRRDDALVTFTQTGFVITASAPFFIASDVGRLFKYGVGSTGAEYYITVYTNSTTVTVDTTDTVAAPTAGTVWYVNTATLVAPVAGLTWSRQASGNGSVITTLGDTATVTHTAVNVSSALAAPATISEIAVNRLNTNASLFDRDIVSPPVALLAGDQAIVTIQLIQKYTPITPLAVGNVATGYDSSGTLQIESFRAGSNNNGLSILSAGGGASTGQSFDPSDADAQQCNVGADFTQQAFNATTSPTGGQGGVGKAAVLGGYGTGTYRRDMTFSYGITEVNGVHYGFSVGGFWRDISIHYTTPWTKLSTQTLTFTWRRTWQRTLTN